MRVLLQVVALAGDVGRDLDTAGQTHTGHLAHRRVRLLRGVGVHAGAHATTLRRALQGRRLGLRELGAATLPDELLNGGHASTFANVSSTSSAGDPTQDPAMLEAAGERGNTRPARRPSFLARTHFRPKSSTRDLQVTVKNADEDRHALGSHRRVPRVPRASGALGTSNRSRTDAGSTSSTSASTSTASAASRP